MRLQDQVALVTGGGSRDNALTEWARRRPPS